MPVKAARPSECGIKDLWEVGGGHDDDTRVLLKAVHLRENLVERFAGVVLPRAAVGAHCVNLIYEDNAWCAHLGCLQYISIIANPTIAECYESQRWRGSVRGVKMSLWAVSQVLKYSESATVSCMSAQQILP